MTNMLEILCFSVKVLSVCNFSTSNGKLSQRLSGLPTTPTVTVPVELACSAMDGFKREVVSTEAMTVSSNQDEVDSLGPEGSPWTSDLLDNAPSVTVTLSPNEAISMGSVELSQKDTENVDSFEIKLAMGNGMTVPFVTSNVPSGVSTILN